MSGVGHGGCFGVAGIRLDKEGILQSVLADLAGTFSRVEQGSYEICPGGGLPWGLA